MSNGMFPSRNFAVLKGPFYQFRGQKTREPIISLQLGLSDLRYYAVSFAELASTVNSLLFTVFVVKNVIKLS